MTRCSLRVSHVDFLNFVMNFDGNFQTSKLCRRDAARSSRHALFPTLRDRQNGLCRERQLMATPTALHHSKYRIVIFVIFVHIYTRTGRTGGEISEGLGKESA